MKPRNFRIINIASLLRIRKAEICDDLMKLKEECGVTDVAFMLPLSPEGREPSMAKAEHLRDLFIEMREPLLGSGLKIGILLQSLIGHGTPTEARFQKSVNSLGAETESMCPLDPEFQEYVRMAVATVAKTKPEFLLVDDDFRLANGGGSGCFCKLHLASLNKAVGANYDREGLLKAMEGDQALKKTWNGIRGSSLKSLAEKIRAGIDEADPELPCGLCICHGGGEELPFAGPNARILAGRKPPFVRIGNAWYLCNDGHALLSRLYWTAAQMEAVKDIPEILAEGDTYPQNRYSMPAKALNSQLALSALDGVTGVKLWVTRLAEHEPGSGLAYREALKANIGMYRELRNLHPSLSWKGPATPFPEAGVPPCNSGLWSSGWICAVLGRMGVPCRMGGDESGTFMLAGREAGLFSDAEIRKFLSKSLLLDGEAAFALCKRGFADLLGVDMDTPADWKASLERMNGDPLNGKSAGRKINLASFSTFSVFKVSSRGGRTRELSRLYRIPWYMSPDEKDIGAGVTLHENKLGGRVAVCAASLEFNPYMNETRREQLINVLDWLAGAQLPAVVASDADIYARYGVIADSAGGGEILLVFNMSMDSLPELKLRLGGAAPAKIRRLESSGKWADLEFSASSCGETVVKTPVEPETALVLKLKRND